MDVRLGSKYASAFFDTSYGKHQAICRHFSRTRIPRKTQARKTQAHFAIFCHGVDWICVTFAILTNKIHTFCKTYVINICLFQFFDYLWINRKPEAYSQPRQTSKIQLFVEIVLRAFQLLTSYDFSNKRHLGCMAGF